MARDASIYKKVCQEHGHDYIGDDYSRSFVCRKCGGTPDESPSERDAD